MDFRNYASKMRSKAADAVSKIPTFDDMAANDDYIHSEEFNVSGNNRTRKRNPGISDSPGTQQVDETQEASSSSSSWSLLDRPSNLLAHAPAPTLKQPPPKEDLSKMIQRSNTMPEDKLIVKNGLGTPRVMLKHASSSLPLLSVVANALGEDNETEQPEPDTDNSKCSESPSNDVLYSDDESDGDEEDPIMALIRQSQPTSKSASGKTSRSRSPRSRSPRRPKPLELETGTSDATLKPHKFMNDLDERLKATGDEELLFLSHEQTPDSAPRNNPVGKWMTRTFGSSRLKPLLNSPLSPLFSIKAGRQTPAPLSRQRQQRQSEEKGKPEEDFQVASSNSLLAADELNELAKLQQSSKHGSLEMLMISIKENHRVLFIALTMVLSAWVYFRF